MLTTIKMLYFGFQLPLAETSLKTQLNEGYFITVKWWNLS